MVPSSALAAIRVMTRTNITGNTAACQGHEDWAIDIEGLGSRVQDLGVLQGFRVVLGLGFRVV